MTRQIILLLLLIEISATVKGQTFTLNSTTFNVGDLYVPRQNILFDLNNWTIKTENYPQLDSIAVFLKTNNKLMLEVGYHTDTKTKETCYCMSLTMKRAESITNYLIEKGVNPKRFIAKGYDDNKPNVVDSLNSIKYPFLPKGKVLTESFINSLSSDEEKMTAHMLNRRVEFKIISTKFKE